MEFFKEEKNVFGAIPYIMFSYVGIIFISLGVFKIEMAESLGVETFSLQYVFGIFSILNMCGIFINRYLLDRVNLKLEIIFFSILINIGVFGMIFSVGKFAFSFFLCLIALGMGVYFSVSNYLVVNIHLKKRSKNLNFLHFCYATASILTPIFAAFFIKFGLSWRIFYAVFGAFPIGVIIKAFKTDFGKISQTSFEKSEKSGFKWSVAACVAVICLFSYVFSEMVFNYWIVEYLVHKGNDKEISKLAISTFWITIALGRYYNSRVSININEVKMIITGSLAGVFSYFLMMNSQHVLIIFISAALMGFFYSGLYALIISVGTSDKENVSPLLMTLLMFSGSVGSISVSPVTAFVRYNYGIRSTMYLGLFSMFFVFLIITFYEFVILRIFKIKDKVVD